MSRRPRRVVPSLKEPIKGLLSNNRHVWDHEGSREAVRKTFNRIISCKEPELGFEVFTSYTEELRVPHTCKAPGCPSCGFRRSFDWIEELDVTLPDIPYASIVFTMPRAFWKLFQQNRHLLHDLPTLAAMVMQESAEQAYGAEILILAIPHTFGAHLNFNSHVHTLVSAGGLRKSDGRWIKRLVFDEDNIMRRWRYLVVTFLREAVCSEVLTSDRSKGHLLALFAGHYSQPWNVKLSAAQTKRHFIEYSGRYLFRQPIAQSRFIEITGETVTFGSDDKKVGWVERTMPTKDFIAMLAEQVPEPNKNQVRYYGLLSPRSKARTHNGLMLLHKLEQKPKPARLTWRELRIKDWVVDPLKDTQGQTMYWNRQVASTVLRQSRSATEKVAESRRVR